MKIVHLGAFASLAALAFSSPAIAKWRIAETKHFTYYSEAPVEELTKTVTELEKFDTLVRALTGNQKPDSPVKLTMFEVGKMENVGHTLPYEVPGVGGYYSSSDVGPFLVTFRRDVDPNRHAARKTSRTTMQWGPEVRQHEYLHHYMYQYFNTNYPTWYSEGFAEFYGTMAFPEENVVEIGHAPYFRLDTIRNGSWVTAKQLLTAKSYADVDDIGGLYAQGWLLTHLGSQNAARGKQLQDYLTKVANGMDYEEAATSSFGDLDALDKELRQHVKNINAIRLSLKPMDIGKVEIRELSDLESELVYYQIRLHSGFVIADLPLASRHIAKLRTEDPDNMVGLEVQARIDYLNKDYPAMLESAQRMVALQPENPTGLLLKGMALGATVPAGSPASAYREARLSLAEAAKLDPNNPEPLTEFYKSYLAEGQLPPENAQNALMAALELAPQNDDIRYLVASDFEKRGLFEDAIYIIQPAAFGTFDGDDGDKAAREKQRARASEKFTGISNYESALDMMHRLEAKRDGTWQDGKTAVASAQE